MIVQVFVTGAATLVVAVGVYLRWLATLPRTVCPSCLEATTTVTHPLRAYLERWVRRRWCAACGWQGWGRNGPVLSPVRGPVSDPSGFRWGPERLEMDFGFRWGPPPQTAMATAESAPVEAAARAHPSGFRWGANGRNARSSRSFHWKA